MKLNKVSVNETLSKAELVLKEEPGLSPAIRAIIEILILLIRAFASRLSINSNNSSLPPSIDKKRKRGSQKEKSNKNDKGSTKNIRLFSFDGRSTYILQNKKLSFNMPKARYYDDRSIRIIVSG